MLAENQIAQNLKIHKAVLRYARITPRKARLVADLVCGLPIDEAEAQLIYNPKRAAKIILKLIESAKAGALSKKLDVNKLYIQNILVNQGPMFKRYLPRARGMATPIQKKTSHITVTLAEKENIKPKFSIVFKKKIKKEKPKSKSLEKQLKKSKEIKEEKIDIQKSKEGFWRRIFRRKAI